MCNNYPKIEKLFRIQKKIIRLMKFKSYTKHTKPLFNDLKILNIFKINDYLTSLFMYRCNCTNYLPDIFNGYFIKNSNIHEHCKKFIREQTIENSLLFVKVLTFGII
jgi:hypothetical protein